MKSMTRIEKTIFILLVFWCLLPIFACIWGLFTAATVHSEILLNGYQLSHYQDLFLFVGTSTLLVLLLHLAKRASTLTLTLSQITSYFKNNIWMLFYTLLVIWILFSALHAPATLIALAGARYRDMGLFTYIVFGCLMLCPLFFHSERTIFVIMYLFLVVADLIAILMLIQEKDIPFLNIALGMLRSSVFVHFNHLGYYLNFACICASGLFIYEEKKNKQLQVFELCSLCLLFYTLLINNTMGGILACLITSIVLLWFYYLRNRQLGWQQLCPLLVIILLVIISCTGILPSSSGEDMHDNFAGLYEDANKLATNEDVGSIGTLRFSLWAYYGKMIPEHPLLGLGPDQEPIGYEEHVISDRPANEYLYHAVFHGIPALIFYLGFLITLAVHQFKHLKELSPSTMIAAGCVITYCISAFFGNALYYTACYFFLFIGFVIPYSSNSKKNTSL